MQKETTANDLIAALDLMFDSIDQASLTLFNRWETLAAEGEDNAASLAIFEALVDYYQAIKDGPTKFNYIEIELGERWNQEMIPLDYHSFTEDDD